MKPPYTDCGSSDGELTLAAVRSLPVSGGGVNDKRGQEK